MTTLKGPNILIVDDNLDNLKVLSGMLAAQNYKVRRAISGAIALRSIEATLPNLILLDILLPDYSGYEICQKLQQNPRTCDIPIIFISALNSTLDKVKAFAAGGVDYITKPFEMAEVWARIHNQLQLQAAKAEVEILNSELEARVQQRTAQLTAAKVKLEQQVQERLLAEQALRQSENRFRALIENTSDLILLLDDQGLVDYASPSLERSLGYVPTAWTGQPLTQWLHPEDQDKAVQLLQAVLIQPSQTLSMEWRWQHCRGDWPVFEAIAQQFTDATGLAWIVVNARDMTERLRVEAIQCALEQEKEMSELKLRFFSMASHEFRTPLSVILMAAQILENSEPQGSDPKGLRNIQRIRASAQSLKKMLSDVLDIARIEAQKLEFKPEWISLRGVCDRILETHQTHQDSQPRLDHTYNGSNAEVYLDPQLLHSILTNLISNALKYSAADQQIEVQVTQLPEKVEFRICDRGIGIPIENQAHLFETFHRGDNVGQIEGSGLGLAIVKKSVDLHNGQITFTSIEGQGTHFTVQLPTSPEIIPSNTCTPSLVKEVDHETFVGGR